MWVYGERCGEETYFKGKKFLNVLEFTNKSSQNTHLKKTINFLFHMLVIHSLFSPLECKLHQSRLFFCLFVLFITISPVPRLLVADKLLSTIVESINYCYKVITMYCSQVFKIFDLHDSSYSVSHK